MGRIAMLWLCVLGLSLLSPLASDHSLLFCPHTVLGWWYRGPKVGCSVSPVDMVTTFRVSSVDLPGVRALRTQ